MAKVTFVIWFFFIAFVHATTPVSLTTSDAFKLALGQFKPSEALPQFTDRPYEASLSRLDKESLASQARVAATQNDTTNLVMNQSRTRERAFSNPNSPEMQMGAHLIEASGSIHDGGCYAQPPICATNTTTKTCRDTVHYTTVNCHDTLTVSIKKTVHTDKRFVTGVNQSNVPFDLSQCRANESNCSGIHLSPNCHSVTVFVTLKGEKIDTSTNQTCSNLMLTIYSKIHAIIAWVDITVVEYASEDVWDNQSCRALVDKASSGVCFFEKGEPCLMANATNIIDGLPIQRPCWGSAMQYQCRGDIESTCTPFINQSSCTQTLSACVEKNVHVCTEYSQTFECSETTCVPQPDICLPEPYCMNGECAQTKNEESLDMGEGVSRLGALAGAANDVATKQIDLSEPQIFAGEIIDCKSYPIGFRDCCTDSGWGDWVQQCPSHLQGLQKAKDENRVVSLGRYRKHKLDLDEHHAFCVFPSILSAIIQKEGRLAQLHIAFGKAKKPDCRGITPQELERINFGKLNLSPIEQALVARLNPPNFENTSTINKAHIERLNQEGKAHD